MNKVIIRDVKDTPCVLYDPVGEKVGEIESVEVLNDIRIQIAEHKLSGYTIKYKDLILVISSEGEIENWPNGFFDIAEKQMIKIIGW
jgi:predicted ATPase